MIHVATCSTIPLRQEPRTRMLVPWWNKECDQAVRSRNTAYKRLRTFPMLVNVMEYKQLRAVARTVIKDAKRNSCREFCGMLGPETPVWHLWSAIVECQGYIKEG